MEMIKLNQQTRCKRKVKKIVMCTGKSILQTKETL